MQIAVIGSGLLSYAAVFALKPFKSRIETIIVYTDGNRGELKRFEGTNQINRYHGFRGTSKYWHGVSVLNGSKEYLSFLEEFYDCDSEFEKACKCLYVPKRLPDLSKKWKDLEIFFGGNLILRHTHVKRIENNSVGIQIYDDKEPILFSHVFLGINVLDIPSIKFDNFPEFKYEIYDHLQVRLGLWRKEDLPKNLVKIDRLTQGYVSSYLRKEDSILMWRPYHGKYQEFKNKQINFGLSKWRIILQVVRSLKISKILEAFFTKFGYFSSSKYYVLFLQKRVSYQKLFEETCYDQSALNDIIEQYGLKKPIVSDGRIILGNHQVGESDNILDGGRVLFGTINGKGWLTGEHHSLKAMYKTQLDVRNSWFSKQ